MGYTLDRLFDMEEVAYFSMILIFGGFGLGAAYLIEKRRSRKSAAARSKASVPP